MEKRVRQRGRKVNDIVRLVQVDKRGALGQARCMGQGNKPN